MNNSYQDRMASIERRKIERRQGQELTAVQRIEMQRAGGDRRSHVDRRVAEIRVRSGR